ncbi:MAG: glycosyltransferase [Ginsengibacter sp.]
MNTKDLPLVSCIMPTYNRRKFVPLAIRYFLRQDYYNKELIIIDDGDDIIEDLIPDNATIRYFKLDKKITLGAKLNLACSYARGEIIANWDDDDWYAKTRLQYQVDALKTEKTEVCGINNLLYYDLVHDHGYRYIYPADQRTWLLGSSLCYRKSLWNRIRFADINVGMDGLFVWATSSDRVKVLSDSTMSVHMIHENNVSPKNTTNRWWHTYPVCDLQEIMKKDWALYQNENLSADIKISSENIAESIRKTNIEPIKNIYACLVHESVECIIDLVRNLHYHDPASIILLYNGGNDLKLFGNKPLFNNLGAVIHPKPRLAKHGYLHQFALDCMEFSLENFSFDSLTIVDSDQLVIRSGYSEHISKFFRTKTDIGLLSSNPERVDKNSVNRVALQAFKEYDLWKPLLDRFKDGEKNFVHWTFWPSTVFAKDAIIDVVKLFKENKLLQDIMERTKIWASEEVILPTLVKLLGYQIASNPCSYDFMKYKKPLTMQDVNDALNHPGIYWMHPVMRSYNDPVRAYIRELSQQFGNEVKNDLKQSSLPERLFDPIKLTSQIKKIEGWLSDREAHLLISTTIKACKVLPSPPTIAEIGSYHGKSTIIFGSIIKAMFPEAKLYAIDPHDGRLGDADMGLQQFPPSFDSFKKNIEDADISDVVEIIRDNSFNVKWEMPVSIIFIDGLHDYLNVARDFHHFSNWIVKSGYIFFHDYAPYFPGVKKFVDELLRTEKYLKVNHVESMIILQKQ